MHAFLSILYKYTQWRSQKLSEEGQTCFFYFDFIYLFINWHYINQGQKPKSQGKSKKGLTGEKKQTTPQNTYGENGLQEHGRCIKC